MRFFLRFIGLLALAGAFAAAVVDGTRWVAGGAWEPMSSGAALYRISPAALTRVQTFIEARVGAWAWNDVMVKALLIPAFIALTVLAALLFLISRPPTPIIGRSSRDP